MQQQGFPGGSALKNLPAMQDTQVQPLDWEDPLEESMATHSFTLAQRIPEGNGTPLQYSCLENPRDGGAWWAAIYGVAQSQTQLKRLSSSSRESHGQRSLAGCSPQGRTESTQLRQLSGSSSMWQIECTTLQMQSLFQWKKSLFY